MIVLKRALAGLPASLALSLMATAPALAGETICLSAGMAGVLLATAPVPADKRSPSPTGR